MSEMICENVQVEAYKQDKEESFMLEEKEGLLAWIKKHKKQLILAGVSIATIVGLILGIKNKDRIMEIWESLIKKLKATPVAELNTVSASVSTALLTEQQSTTRAYTTPKEPFDVSGHVRNMGLGKHHSLEKASEAAALGIELLPNQTWVSTYPKCAA